MENELTILQTLALLIPPAIALAGVLWVVVASYAEDMNENEDSNEEG